MSYKHDQLLLKKTVILYLTSILSILSSSSSYKFTNERFERSIPLLFTNTSVTTFICGFGIPVHNLNPELVTVGMVFKAQQFLPSTFQTLRQPSSHRIERQSNKLKHVGQTLSKYRIYFYRALEQMSTSLGQKGHECVLKMICETSTISFHYRNGIIGELISILFTPSSSFDTYETTQDYDYVNAEKLGKSGLSCKKLFKDCNESILERISNVFD